MIKPKEIEELVKGAIREELALHPLKSVMQIRSTLFKHGYQAVNGPLDYHYISRLVKAIRMENILALNATTRAERLAIFRERHRAITERLADILDGKPSQSFDKPNYPTNGERVAAAATILKWDMALLIAEEQYPRQDQKDQRVSYMNIHTKFDNASVT